MSEAVRLIFAEWRLPLWTTLAMLVTAAIYIRGWHEIRKTRPEQFNDVRLASFCGGLLILWLATVSPLDGFADSLLTVHMIEHLLLMSAIPMLLLYGLPVVPLLRGLPAPLRQWTAVPLLRAATLRRAGHWLVKPAIAWLGTPLLPRHLASLLVDHPAALAGGRAPQQLGRADLPCPVGHRDDPALRISHLLRSAGLSLLRRASQPVWAACA
jgi:hypothetical protein